MADVLIELGEEHGAVPDRPWTPRRVLSRWRPPARLDRWRATALLATAVLVLAAGGAARWPGQPLRLVGRFTVDAGAAVMVDAGRFVVLGDAGALAAYSTRDGRPLWRAPLDLATAYGSMTVSDGVVLVSSQAHDGLATATEAVDEATGRSLWSSPSTVFMPLPGTGSVLLAPQLSPRLQLVDVHTGRLLWDASTTGCNLTFDVPVTPPTPHALALLCAGGAELDVVDLRTGAPTVVPLAPVDPPAAGVSPQLTTAGPAVVVERQDGPSSTLIEAYPWRGGPRLWSRPGLGLRNFLAECGGHLCEYGERASAVLDPLTGATLPLPLPRDPRVPVGATVFSFTLDRDPRTMLVVPQGRATPPDASGFVVYAQPAGTSQVLQPYTAGAALPGNSPFAAHPSFVLERGTVLAQLVGADGRAAPLQLLPGITPSLCVATVTYLICPTASGVASVWEFPAG